MEDGVETDSLVVTTSDKLRLLPGTGYRTHSPGFCALQLAPVQRLGANELCLCASQAGVPNGRAIREETAQSGAQIVWPAEFVAT